VPQQRYKSIHWNPVIWKQPFFGARWPVLPHIYNTGAPHHPYNLYYVKCRKAEQESIYTLAPYWIFYGYVGLHLLALS
jgi:hypothetical protein